MKTLDAAGADVGERSVTHALVVTWAVHRIRLWRSCPDVVCAGLRALCCGSGEPAPSVFWDSQCDLVTDLQEVLRRHADQPAVLEAGLAFFTTVSRSFAPPPDSPRASGAAVAGGASREPSVLMTGTTPALPTPDPGFMDVWGWVFSAMRDFPREVRLQSTGCFFLRTLCERDAGGELLGPILAALDGAVRDFPTHSRIPWECLWAVDALVARSRKLVASVRSAVLHRVVACGWAVRIAASATRDPSAAPVEHPDGRDGAAAGAEFLDRLCELIAGGDLQRELVAQLRAAGLDLATVARIRARITPAVEQADSPQAVRSGQFTALLAALGERDNGAADNGGPAAFPAPLNHGRTVRSVAQPSQ